MSVVMLAVNIPKRIMESFAKFVKIRVFVSEFSEKNRVTQNKEGVFIKKCVFDRQFKKKNTDLVII